MPNPALPNHDQPHQPHHTQSIDLSACKSKLDADQELAKADVLDPQLRAFALMNVLHDRKTNTLSWRSVTHITNISFLYLDKYKTKY